MKMLQVVFLLSTTLSFFLVGCSGMEIRHLSSDASLLVPGQTTKQDVVSYIGPPDDKTAGQAAGEETWIYYQARQSTLKKLPLIGSQLGYEEFDVLRVAFAGDVVKEVTYRLYNEAGFWQLGLRTSEQDEHQ